MFQLKDHWRLMKVKHGDSHPGGINKIEVITRHELSRAEIKYNDYRGGSNVEVHAFIKGYGRVVTMKELEKAVVSRRTPTVEVAFRSYDRNNGRITGLEKVEYQRQTA